MVLNLKLKKCLFVSVALLIIFLVLFFSCKIDYKNNTNYGYKLYCVAFTSKQAKEFEKEIKESGAEKYCTIDNKKYLLYSAGRDRNKVKEAASKVLSDYQIITYSCRYPLSRREKELINEIFNLCYSETESVSNFYKSLTKINFELKESLSAVFTRVSECVESCLSLLYKNTKLEKAKNYLSASIFIKMVELK